MDTYPIHSTVPSSLMDTSHSLASKPSPRPHLDQVGEEASVQLRNGAGANHCEGEPLPTSLQGEARKLFCGLRYMHTQMCRMAANATADAHVCSVAPCALCDMRSGQEGPHLRCYFQPTCASLVMMGLLVTATVNAAESPDTELPCLLIATIFAFHVPERGVSRVA